ncbi:MAG: hypothetical protein ACREJ3_16750 [Polyangiaceae bacterium]
MTASAPGAMARPLVWGAMGLLVFAWSSSSSADSADDHATAQGLVTLLGKDTVHRAVLASSLESASAALERATRMRVAGDDAHALIAEGLALEWAETARDLALAADAEEATRKLSRKALEEEAQLERSRAQVAEGIVRVGRLRAKAPAPPEPRDARPRKTLAVTAGARPPAATSKAAP